MASVWTPPSPFVRSVAAGVVVTVRARLQKGAPSIGPDGRGIPPHVVYRPDLESLGTGAPFAFDPVTGAIGPEVGERPTTSIDEPIPGETPEWWIDFGRPFRCPWPGRIALEGGLVTLPDTTTAIDVSIVRTMPQDATEVRDFLDLASGGSYRRSVTRQTGASPIAPLQPSAITFQAVGPRKVQTPRGAYAVVSPVAASVDFEAFGLTTTIPLPAGAVIPLGLLSQGTFHATGGGPIAQLSFLVEIG